MCRLDGGDVHVFGLWEATGVPGNTHIRKLNQPSCTTVPQTFYPRLQQSYNPGWLHFCRLFWSCVCPPHRDHSNTSTRTTEASEEQRGMFPATSFSFIYMAFSIIKIVSRCITDHQSLTPAQASTSGRKNSGSTGGTRERDQAPLGPDSCWWLSVTFQAKILKR